MVSSSNKDHPITSVSQSLFCLPFVFCEMYHIKMDNESLTDATEIYFSATSITIYYIIGMCFFCVGIYLATHKRWSGYLLLILALMAVIHAHKISKQNAKPYLLLNSYGIMTRDNPIIPWKSIDSAQVLLAGVGGRYHKWYLKLRIKDKYDHIQDKKIELRDLTLSPKEIENLIHQYHSKSKDSE